MPPKRPTASPQSAPLVSRSSNAGSCIATEDLLLHADKKKQLQMTLHYGNLCSVHSCQKYN